MPTNKYFKCPFCDKRLTREDMVRHIEKYHEDELPEEFTPLRATFHAVNRKDFSYVRPCRMCKSPTKWDEAKGRYDQLCGSKACHDAQVEKMRKDMGDKLGINRQTATAEGLQKMLANRRISGKYKFQDGIEFAYTGSYEKKTLEFFDEILNIKGSDLMIPGPPLQYTLDGKKHIYIPDIYYIPYNLMIEVKDGGNRPNNNPQLVETRRRQMAKEEYIVRDTDYNYIRLTNNDFSQIISIFADLKMATIEEPDIKKARRVVHVNESSVKSNLNKEFEPKGKLNLSSFKRVHITEDIISKYKKEYPFLKHVRCKDTDYYKCDGYMWFDKEKLVCYVGSCEYLDDKTKWIVSLEIVKDYQGYGLSKQILNYATKVMSCKYLSVNKDNEIAKNVYDKYGFKVYQKSDKMYYMTIDNSYQLSESMVSTIHAAIPQVGNNDVVVVNYYQNNVFAGKSRLAVADNIKFDSVFRIDDYDGKLKKCSKSFLEECKYDTYIVDNRRDIVLEGIVSNLDKEVDEHFLENLLFGHPLLSNDQIMFENARRYEDFYGNINAIAEATIKEIKGE